uniref:Uncharacterized protein n=1 Tax=Cyprinus carpio TaxID=7962 RepID=A0A8C2GWK8_CYPCA
ILREKAKPRLDFEFTLHYEDPDFGGQLSCLVDIQECKNPEKATFKMIGSESDTRSCASSDTDILPLVPIRQRQKSWPDIFPCLCNFWKLTQKHNILENMAAVMYNFKPYPSDNDVGMAAEALVTAHPCLKEPGSVSGWYGWTMSLKFKMGDYCGKLSRSGCLEVSVNAGRRSKNNPDKEHPHSNIKRARRGESQASLEEMRLQIMDEVQKSQQNLRLIEMRMQKTFSLRCKEIIQENPQVKAFLGKWLALRIESQLCAEFQRITNVNLRNQFYAVLDQHTPGLVALYRHKAERTGKISEALRDILKIYELQRTVALRALPVYLCEEDPQFFQTWNVSIQYIHRTISISSSHLTISSYPLVNLVCRCHCNGKWTVLSVHMDIQFVHISIHTYM